MLIFCVWGTFKFKTVHCTFLCAICVTFSMCWLATALEWFRFGGSLHLPIEKVIIKHFSLAPFSPLCAFLSSLTSFYFEQFLYLFVLRLSCRCYHPMTEAFLLHKVNLLGLGPKYYFLVSGPVRWWKHLTLVSGDCIPIWPLSGRLALHKSLKVSSFVLTVTWIELKEMVATSHALPF